MGMNVVIARTLPDAPDPVEALAGLRGVPGRALLHSATAEGGFSFLGADPPLRLVGHGPDVRVRGPGGRGTLETFPDPFAALEALTERFRTPPAEDLPHGGGLVGYLGYETGDVLERLPPPPPDDVGVPDAWFGVYDCGLLWDRRGTRCRVVGSVLPGRAREDVLQRMETLVRRVRAGVEAARGRRESRGEASPSDREAPLVESSLGTTAFQAGVAHIQERIRAGDLFQANLTRRISVPTRMDGLSLYRNLLRESPADHAAYLDTGLGEVASISPELFLSVRAGRVTTRPIKGTAPRGGTEVEDRALAEALGSSGKDHAENVMIVDLLRNDLSRVCRPGSIQVPELARLQTHPTVHHLVSTVTGTLTEDAGPVDLLRATFPGGSITGAPKIQAMRLLGELEPVRRGVYTGALGILGFQGDLELSVAIRTVVLRDGRAHYGTGGGITLGSVPEEEWRETEDKARAFFRAVGVAARRDADARTGEGSREAGDGR
jgi:para-aminobenzoate synthetase component I